MTMLKRRELLIFIAAIGGAAIAPAQAFAAPGMDHDGAMKVGEAYLREHPTLEQKSLQRELLPAGWSPDAIANLRQRVSGDFRDGHIFIHRGWHISDTEGRLFALAALAER